LQKGRDFGLALCSCTIESIVPLVAPRLFRSLRHPNYRLFFFGQSISLVGTWITRIASSWLVYRLTDSEFLLGLVAFAGQIPSLVVSPIAGVYIDRWNKHRVLVITQALAMLQSTTLAYLTLTGRITVNDVLVLQGMQGLINAFDTPARQSFVAQMVDDRADLPNAIALNSALVNGSRMIGPAIGGVLIAAVGEGWCFALDAVSYIFVIASLLAMRVSRAAKLADRTPVVTALAAGFRYVSEFAPVRSGLLLVALVSTLGMPYQVLMPVMATEVLGGGASMLGMLMTATGVGALGGSVYLASRHTVLGLGRRIAQASMAFGAALIAFSLSTNVWISFALLPLTGAGFIITLAATNTVVQTVVPETLRGRVMSLYTVAFLGTAPIGSLLAGLVAERVGAPTTIGIGGAACLAGGAWFYSTLPRLRELIRPVYAERGLLVVPDADSGTKSL
jgi:MFS family permease